MQTCITKYIHIETCICICLCVCTHDYNVCCTQGIKMHQLLQEKSGKKPRTRSWRSCIDIVIVVMMYKNSRYVPWYITIYQFIIQHSITVFTSPYIVIALTFWETFLNPTSATPNPPAPPTFLWKFLAQYLGYTFELGCSWLLGDIFCPFRIGGSSKYQPLGDDYSVTSSLISVGLAIGG